MCQDRSVLCSSPRWLLDRRGPSRQPSLWHHASLIQSVESGPDAFGIWYRSGAGSGSRSWTRSRSGTGTGSRSWSRTGSWISTHEFCCAADSWAAYTTGDGHLSHCQHRGGYLCVSVSVALLLLRLGSVTPIGAVTVAVLESGPYADALIVPRAV